jgi:hypothetical protein
VRYTEKAPARFIIKYALGELHVISRARVGFFGALLILAAGIWWAMDWRYSAIISPAAFTAARKRDDIENRSASKISADHRVQTEVSSKPTSARRSGSPSPPFRQLRTLREHPLRS